MNWSDELTRIRRYLRDPDGNIWSTPLLLELWNQASAQLAREVMMLRDVRVLPVPPRFQGSYMYYWEWASRGDGTRYYRCLLQAGGHFVATAMWEVQQFAGVTPDADDIGHAYTHPWEAFFVTPNQPPPVAFPDDVSEALGVYWDSEPIEYMRFRDVLQRDPTWRSRAGETFSYFMQQEVENEMVLYPRPSSVDWNDDTGDGWVTSVSGDTTSSDIGIITQRTGNVLNQDTGVAVDALDTAGNVTILYNVAPTRMTAITNVPEWPEYLWRFLRYRVLELAYQANTDGNIPTLARFWGSRYRIGVGALRRFVRMRGEDRDYVLSATPGARRAPKRHARLPDSYPPV